MLRDLVDLISNGIKIKVSAEFTITPVIHDEPFTALCADCGWKYDYTTLYAMRRGLKNHRRGCAKVRINTHHRADPESYEWISEMHNDENKGNGE